jgi:hypothetical protein
MAGRSILSKKGNSYTSEICEMKRKINKVLSPYPEVHPDGEFVGKWGSEGSGDGELDAPLGIAVDSSGYVYVSESGLKTWIQGHQWEVRG